MSAHVLIVLVAAGVLVVYLMRCAFWPYGQCWRCKDRRGRSAGSSAKAYGYCCTCQGNDVMRLGARLLKRMGIPLPGERKPK